MADVVPEGGMRLAERWKLVELNDKRNWELCELRLPKDRHGNVKSDKPMWFRCGRYYQYNTMDEAMLYVINELAKEEARDEMCDLSAHYLQWQHLVEWTRQNMREMVDAWRRR